MQANMYVPKGRILGLLEIREEIVLLNKGRILLCCGEDEREKSWKMRKRDVRKGSQ